MYLPSAVVLQEYPCGKGTPRDEENHSHAEVCNDNLPFALPGSRNLYLRGYEYEAAKGDKEPLVDEKPLDGEETSAPLGFRWT